MRHFFNVILLGALALTLGACHCNMCSTGLPGNACEPCAKPPKPLRPPVEKKRCEFPRFPERPVKCVATQIARKCCHCECIVNCDGEPVKIEVCEITYKSLYTDGSCKLWTEVSRNPYDESPTKKGRRSNFPPKHSIVGNRCDSCDSDE